MNEYPTFAVVGHPNKGKSSIVATLARDDTVAIAPEPGTTIRCRHYPMQVDGRVLYVLVDTPGFQRARKALSWIRTNETTADKHAQVVQQFVNWHRSRNLMNDECELLEPILAGAGILYVVDGSVPYGPEYEAEMEILRWTGRPSMAMINPIGPADHTEAWRVALDQYFKIVRVFNAMTAEHHKRVELLRAFGQLNEKWQAPLEEAAELLVQERQRQLNRSAHLITQMLADMINLKVNRSANAEEEVNVYKPALIEQYKNRLRLLEQKCRSQIESVYALRRLDRRESAFDILDEDLFASSTWRLWGLKRHQLLLGGAAGGAAIGGIVDSSLGGTSLLAGTVIGAAVGAAASWWSMDQMAKVQVFGRSMGRKVLQVGPMNNVNMAFIILNRARYHHLLIAHRTHAQRDELAIDPNDSPVNQLTESLNPDTRRDLHRYLTKWMKTDDLLVDTEHLFILLNQILTHDLS